MALSTAYLVTTKNFDAIFNALLSAKAPEKLTTGFLKTLGFTSSNDSLYIRVFKEIGLLDSSNAPTDKYFRFLDQTESKKVLAECIEEGYSDLFALNKRAYELSEEEVKNKFKTLTQGSKEDNILGLMAKTFKALCNYADFSKNKPNEITIQKKEDVKIDENRKNEDANKLTHELINKKITTEMHYNIQIHLPESRDITVYDAIFKSLKEHLL